MNESVETTGATYETKKIGRRLFLSVLGLGAVGVALGPQLQNIEASLLSIFSKKSGTGIAALVPGSSRFRIYSVTDSIPYVAPTAYRLSVGGLSATSRTFTIDELKALPATSLTKDFQCVTGWRVPSVPWKGVLLRDLLALVDPKKEATAVEFTSFDGVYTESLTIAEAQRDDVLVAYEMLDAPVTPEHGGPVRMYVAPMYGYKSTKWLQSINLVRTAIPGYWEQNGYEIEGWIGRSNGRSDLPVD